MKQNADLKAEHMLTIVSKWIHAALLLAKLQLCVIQHRIAISTIAAYKSWTKPEQCMLQLVVCI